MRRRARLLWRELGLAIALALLAGTGACGGDGGETPQEELSIVVIHVTINANVPTMYKVRVNAHLGGMGDSVLTFPNTPTGRPIQSGDSLALLIPTTRYGKLDLGLAGLDANDVTVATGNGQVDIMVGRQVDVTILLSAL
jgi:hypothetical protein